MGRPFSQQVDVVPTTTEAPLDVPLPALGVIAVPAFCDVCERAPGDNGPGWVPPFGLNDGGGFVSESGDWALMDVVVVVAAVADCPRSCK